MGKKLEEVKKTIQSNEAELRKLGVKEIYIFGSVVRGEEHESSDIDVFIVINEDRQIGFLGLAEIEIFLSKKLNSKIDLGTKKSLHPLLKEQILKEAIRVA